MREIREIDDLFQLLEENDINYDNIKINDCFIEKISYKIKIEAIITSTKEELKGFATAEMLGICSSFQDTIYKLYAFYYKNKKDARSLTEEEKQKLTCLFEIHEGSVEEILKNIKEILIFLQNMSTKSFIAVVLIILGGITWKYLDTKSNDKMYDFLKETTKQYQEVVLSAITNNKIQLKQITFNDEKPITLQEVNDIKQQIDDKKNDIQKATINKKMVVKKLYTKGNNKMATLFNEEEKISIETDFIENLFTQKQDILFNSFAKELKINCKIFIEKNINGIVKATLIDIQN